MCSRRGRERGADLGEFARVEDVHGVKPELLQPLHVCAAAVEELEHVGALKHGLQEVHVVVQRERVDEVGVAGGAQLQQARQRVERPHAVGFHVDADHLHRGSCGRGCQRWRLLAIVVPADCAL